MGWIERRRTCVSGLLGHRVVTGTLDGICGYECLGMTAGTSIEHTAPVATYISSTVGVLAPYLAGSVRASEDSRFRIGIAARVEILPRARTIFGEFATTTISVEEGMQVVL